MSRLPIYLPGFLAVGLLAIAGCAGEQRNTEEQAVAGQSACCQATEQKLAEETAKTQRLLEELEETQHTAATATTAVKQTEQQLKESQAAQTALQGKVTALTEKNVDLEMAYGELTEQIRELKKQLTEQRKKLKVAKDTITQGEQRLKNNEKQHAAVMQKAKGETEAARLETKTLGEQLDTANELVEKLQTQKTVLEREAAQLPGMRKALTTLQGEKLALQTSQKKATEKIAALSEQVGNLSNAVQAAGVALPDDVTALSDWELVKRVATERFEGFKSGQFRGDEMDIAIAGGAGLCLLLVMTTLLSMFIALRAKRKLRRTLNAGDPPPATVEQPPATVGHSDEEVADMDTSEVVPPALATPPQTEEPGGPPPAADPEATEVFEPVMAGAPQAEVDRVEGSGGEPPHAEVVERAFAPVEKKVDPEPEGKKEDVLGDLRNVINRKFDELLQK